jgi:hypothetical protein
MRKLCRFFWHPKIITQKHMMECLLYSTPMKQHPHLRHMVGPLANHM